VSDSTYGAGAIEDASVYSLKPNMNAGTWTYNHAGYYDSTYGVARTAVRLTDLLSSSEYTSFGRDDVLSAKFYITEATGSAPANVKLHALTGNSTWTESNVTWNSVGAYSSMVYATASMSYDQTAEFDITNHVKSWKGGYFGRGQCGFLLIGENETSIDKALYSSEYGTTSKRPYVTVTYSSDTFGTVYYLNNLFTGEFIRYDSTSSQNLYCAPEQVSESGPYMRWRLTRTEKGYTIRPILDTSKCLAVINGAVSLATVYSTETIPDNCIWVFTQIDGDQYTIRNFGSAGYLNSTGAGLSASSESVAPNSDAQKARTWRLATASEYGASSAYVKRELTGFSATGMVLKTGESGSITISAKQPVSAQWSADSEFVAIPLQEAVSNPSNYSPPISVNGITIEAEDTEGIYPILVKHRVTGVWDIAVVVVSDYYSDFSFSYEMHHRMDKGFLEKFDVSYITNAADVLEEKLNMFFGLNVSTTVGSSYFSPADECLIKHYESVTSVNMHPDKCLCELKMCFYQEHMLNDTDIANGSTIKTNCGWTGYPLLGEETSASDPDRFKMLITPKFANEETTAAGKLNSLTATLWHETSHQLGAVDHYCKKVGNELQCSNTNCDICYNDMEKSRDCLMSTAQFYKDNLDTYDIYCADCINAITAHLFDHHA